MSYASGHRSSGRGPALKDIAPLTFRALGANVTWWRFHSIKGHQLGGVPLWDFQYELCHIQIVSTSVT